MGKGRKLSSRLEGNNLDAHSVAFGRVLRRRRLELSVSQEQLSWESGVDRKFISRIERGVKEPCLETIIKLTRALEIPLGEFMGEVEKELNG